MSLPVDPIPWRLYPLLALFAGGLGWLFWHAVKRQDRRRRDNDHE